MQLEREQIFLGIFALAGVLMLLSFFFMLLIVRNAKRNTEARVKLLEAVLAAQESERERIGRNLHDELGTLLSLLKLTVDRIVLIDSLPKVKEIAGETKGQIDDTLAEVRKIVNDIFPSNLLKYGFIKAIGHLANSINARESIRVEFKSDVPEEVVFTKNAELFLYRILQEIMTNAIKHARCKTIKLDVLLDQDRVRFLVQDDGLGFDANKVGKGVGIENIKSRVALFKGSLELLSAPGRGTTYDIAIPLTHLIEK